ncbi:3-deoxy-manno-octulosonate cytidylyltransferase [Christiangramia sediminis]|uniref:3-deoxy-manno-octulosonate cytidylyltransferase n=1 Tax=Christiangramia sediminis TaxID=2881336 RepID=A0A9X1RUI8_9FLAO|nr:3-deoxy-manno-octulosonate cytidylyltransferase [Christiangramia sediminis]MCB7480618.1 3-deoxy-manno-octulosonate cytidylyltransferase [Christiangramia sediminis]
MKEFIIVIPARLQSTRLPEKPLILIKGKSIIQRTYEQCLKAVKKELIYIATDSIRIYDHCKALNMNVLMTSKDVLTGTDRVCEVAEQIEAKYYINVQGDEPVFNPDDIKVVLRKLDSIKDESTIINGYTSIKNFSEYNSVSVPKVVFKPNGELLYMSRSPIPGNKSSKFIKAWRQVCIYAFPNEALKNFSKIKKTPLEEQEDIEILRFLELGYKVNMIELSSQSIPVDHPEDVLKVEKFLNENLNAE